MTDDSITAAARLQNRGENADLLKRTREIMTEAGISPDTDTAEYARILNAPEFRGPYRIFDWRDFIPESLKSCWLNLSIDARACLYYMAKRAAHVSEYGEED